MSHVIIGVHGLANKPEAALLEQWWRKSLQDGQKHVDGPTQFEFDLVYWAGALYKNPQHNDPNFDFDSLYNEEPYTEPAGLEEYNEGWRDSVRATAQGWGGDLLDLSTRVFGEGRLQKHLLGKLLKDLAYYYNPERTLAGPDGARKQARSLLDEFVLSKLEEHRGKKILLIAHSMGSIISYNALRDWGQKDPNAAVESFVTIGSPLGLPYVKGKILEERKYSPEVRTPTVVKNSWVNFADKRDPVALDERLADDYKPNLAGVGVRDDLVYNDYRAPKTQEHPEGKSNAHKSYGYLRSPELARHVKAFLAP